LLLNLTLIIINSFKCNIVKANLMREKRCPKASITLNLWVSAPPNNKTKANYLKNSRSTKIVWRRDP
jgi:hypothetical protein